jgi:hypothetical protein
MDAFQGSYRIQPRDLRYFSAFYLFMRFMMLLQLYIINWYFTSGMLFLLSAVLIVIFQPYKVRAHNTVDSVLMILTGIVCISFYAHSEKIVVSFRVLSLSLLLLYFISLLVWKLVGGILLALMRKIKAVWNHIVHHPRECCEGEPVVSFDRELDNERNSYPPLLDGSQRLTS